MIKEQFYSKSKSTSVNYGPFGFIRPKQFNCHYCKKEFTIYSGQHLYKHEKNIFCSYKCRSNWKKENLK